MKTLQTTRAGRELYIPDPINDWLDKLAEAKGCSRSRVVQDAITREWKNFLRRKEGRRDD